MFLYKIQFRTYYAVARFKTKMFPYTKNLNGVNVTLLTASKKSMPLNSSDTFDIFISDLMDTKSQAWKNKSKISRSTLIEAEKKSYQQNSEIVLNESDILAAAKMGDIELTSKLLMNNKDMAINYMKEIAKIFEEAGDLKGILLIEKYVGKEVVYIHRLNCLQKRGENVQALILCEEIYNQYPQLRREVRSHLAHVLSDIVGHQSDAALVKGKDIVECIGVNHGDFRPMAFLWQACFISEWFSDQQVASQLLSSIVQHDSIQVVERRMLAAVFTVLGQHRPERVYSLLEDLLRCNLLQHFTSILRILFDYKCSNGDLKGCAAILSTSLEFNVTFTSQQHARFLDLLCQKKSWFPPSIKKKHPKQTGSKPDPPPPFQMKF